MSDTRQQIAVHQQAFYRDILRSQALPRNTHPEDAVRAVFCVLTQRISDGQAEDFAGLLPTHMQALLRPCVIHREESHGLFERREFLREVAAHFDIDMDEAEDLSRSVFAAMRAHLRGNEVDRAASQLPPDLAQLWRAPH